MKDLNYELKKLCQRNRDGSYATRHDRERILTLVANQLHETGFKDMKAISLKPKHVTALVERWKAEALAVGTIKARMSVLRWWAEKIHKQNVIARDNAHYGIPNRQNVTNVSRARNLTTADLAKVTDPYTRLSLKLQATFGLRRGESIKIRPEWADRGDRLELKDTWTKGGRERDIPIRTEQQRSVLEEAKQLAGKGSLIPHDVCTAIGALQGAVSGRRHPACAWTSPSIRAGPLSGVDRLACSGTGWAYPQATDA